MNKKLNVFFTIDKNYIPHFAATLTSLLENNKHLKFDIYVIHDIKEYYALRKLKNYFKRNYNICLELLSLESAPLEKFKISKHVSKATYFRLLLTDIIPAHVTEGLFLDSDIIVTGSLDYFFEDKFSSSTKGDHQCLIFAANEGGDYNVKRLNRLGVPIHDYFNAGVMYINLKGWRVENASRHLMNIAQKYKEDLLWWDQDVLNIHFYNRWCEIPSAYNAAGLQVASDKIPTIIHFTGVSKPWSYKNQHPYRHIYNYYRQMTPYKYYIPLLTAVYKKSKSFLTSILESE